MTDILGVPEHLQIGNPARVAPETEILEHIRDLGLVAFPAAHRWSFRWVRQAAGEWRAVFDYRSVTRNNFSIICDHRKAVGLIVLRSGGTLPNLNPLSLTLDYTVWSDIQGWFGYAKRYCSDPGDWVVFDRERFPDRLKGLLIPNTFIRVGAKWDFVLVVHPKLDKPVEVPLEPRRIDDLILTGAMHPLQLHDLIDHVMENQVAQ